MSLMRQTCREWNAVGSCRFGEGCRFQHDGTDAACDADFTSEQCKITVSNISQPLLTSASGSVIHFGPLDVPKLSAMLSDKRTDFLVEFHKRLLLVLLQQFSPHLAPEIAKKFSPSERCAIFARLASEDFATVFQQLIRQRISEAITLHDAQTAGFCRLARICCMEHNGPSCQHAADVFSTAVGRWSCAMCAFQNEDTSAQACSSCASPRRNPLYCHATPDPLLNYYPSQLLQASSAFSGLQPDEAASRMRKLEKKLNQVSEAPTAFDA